MAKIKKIALKATDKLLAKGKIKVLTNIEFHPLDLKLQMEYILHLFIYEKQEQKSIPVLISNWDDTKIIEVAKDDKKNEFLGKKHLLIKTEQLQNTTFALATSVQLKPRNTANVTPTNPKELEVFATLIPAVDSVSKWSKSLTLTPKL